MMNALTLVIGLVAICPLAYEQRALASNQVTPPDMLCHSIATQATGSLIDDLRKQMREALAQSDWRYIRPLIWEGSDPGWTRNTKWHKLAVQEALNRNLVHASAIGDTHLIVKLIREGANVNAKAHFDENASPLIWAAKCDQASAARLLLDKGADVNITTDYSVGSNGLAEGSTALMWAALYGNVSVIKILLAHGANPNAQLKITPDNSRPSKIVYGGAPLLQAKNNETAELLLKGKADPNLAGPDGISPLMSAARDGDLDRCKLLLAWGADPFLKDANGHTAADLAEEGGNPAVVTLLKGLR
jgi:ankyrin repeat protein